mmetsp:Transcript_30034/g.70132  ORF Transcript_30034/g.70132 Transcript_30034/m.70132 type:complete len:356 (+) Transcript_30034:333-1400(+)
MCSAPSYPEDMSSPAASDTLHVRRADAALRMCRHSPFLAAHTRAVRSPDADMTLLQSGENVTAYTYAPCLPTHCSEPPCMFHTRTVLSVEAVAHSSMLPAISASSTVSLCPVRQSSWLTDSRLHTLAVASMEPVTNRVPSLLNFSERMHSWWKPISMVGKAVAGLPPEPDLSGVAPPALSSASCTLKTRIMPSSHPPTSVWGWLGWNLTTLTTAGTLHFSTICAPARSHTLRWPCSEQAAPHSPVQLMEMLRTMSLTSPSSGSASLGSSPPSSSMACSRSSSPSSSFSRAPSSEDFDISCWMLSRTVLTFHTRVSLSAPDVTSQLPSSDTEVLYMISSCACRSSCDRSLLSTPQK